MPLFCAPEYIDQGFPTGVTSLTLIAPARISATERGISLDFRPAVQHGDSIEVLPGAAFPDLLASLEEVVHRARSSHGYSVDVPDAGGR